MGVMVGDFLVHLSDLRPDKLVGQAAGDHETNSSVSETVRCAAKNAQLHAQGFQHDSIDLSGLKVRPKLRLEQASWFTTTHTGIPSRPEKCFVLTLRRRVNEHVYLLGSEPTGRLIAEFWQLCVKARHLA